MCADDTSILNVGQDMNELQNTTPNNTGTVEQYFEINNLSINPSQHTIFSSRQDSAGRKVNWEISNVKSTDFQGSSNR
jgi:hypothetical protein